jgi:SSS family solute:Na+ symporter
MILMTTAVLLANNLYRAIDPAADGSSLAKLAKLLVPAIAVTAVFFTLRGGQTIVALLLMGYSFVTQMFPALVLSLTRRRWVTREGASCGIVAGVATVAVTSLRHVSIGTLFPSLPVAIKELNVGIIALAVNFLVLILVSGAVRLGKAREHGLTADTSPS